MKQCYVYWIHLPEHTDMFSQGYIGITTQGVEERFKEHVALSKLSGVILSRAIKKHGSSVIVKTVLIGSTEYCLDIEYKLRPSDRIGWNTVAGGGKPPVFTKGHTQESKDKIGAGSRRTSQSEAHKAARLRKIGVPRTEYALRGIRASSLKRNEFARSPERIIELADIKSNKSKTAKEREHLRRASQQPWETPRCDKDLWAIADRIFSFWQSKDRAGRVSVARHFQIESEHALTNMIKKFKNQWNPSIDAKWLEWSTKYKLDKEKETS